jgi:hypothetical protein
MAPRLRQPAEHGQHQAPVRRRRVGPRVGEGSLRRLLAEVGPGDVVMVTRLDRLARSTRDLLNTLAAITGKKAGFRCGRSVLAPLATSPEYLFRSGRAKRAHLRRLALPVRRYPRIPVDHGLDSAINLRKKKAQSDQRPASLA